MKQNIPQEKEESKEIKTFNPKLQAFIFATSLLTLTAWDLYEDYTSFKLVRESNAQKLADQKTLKLSPEQTAILEDFSSQLKKYRSDFTFSERKNKDGQKMFCVHAGGYIVKEYPWKDVEGIYDKIRVARTLHERKIAQKSYKPMPKKDSVPLAMQKQHSSMSRHQNTRYSRG